uniref:WW domain-containing protein n=1 Tax=Lactuca sativa TaxID=4236 RepID=A0A9R1UWQ0_LACSA|nr:hypothetical protein LSAT_V11C700363460 [Lactuca sativa]
MKSDTDKKKRGLTDDKKRDPSTDKKKRDLTDDKKRNPKVFRMFLDFPEQDKNKCGVDLQIEAHNPLADHCATAPSQVCSIACPGAYLVLSAVGVVSSCDDTGVEQLDAWSAHMTETRILYYFNYVTGQSTYQKPPGFKREQVPTDVTEQRKKQESDVLNLKEQSISVSNSTNANATSLTEKGSGPLSRCTHKVILSVSLTTAGVIIVALGGFSFDLFGCIMALISVFF